MHIMEGFLPVTHAIGWTLAAAPFVGYGLHTIKKSVRENPERRMLLGVAAAFTFVLSALKLPSVTGSSSHPTGTGLGAVLFGPTAMAPIGSVSIGFASFFSVMTYLVLCPRAGGVGSEPPDACDRT